MVKFKIGMIRTKNGMNTVTLYSVDLTRNSWDEQKEISNQFFGFMNSRGYATGLKQVNTYDKTNETNVRPEIEITIPSDKFDLLIDDIESMNKIGMKHFQDKFDSSMSSSDFAKAKEFFESETLTRGANAGCVNVKISFKYINRETQVAIMNKLAQSYTGDKSKYNITINTKNGNMTFFAKDKAIADNFQYFVREQMKTYRGEQSNNTASTNKEDVTKSNNTGGHSANNENRQEAQKEPVQNQAKTSHNNASENKAEAKRQNNQDNNSSIFDSFSVEDFSIKKVISAKGGNGLIRDATSKYVGNFKLDFNIFSGTQNIDKIIDEVKKHLSAKDFVLAAQSFSSSFAKNLHHLSVYVKNEQEIALVDNELNNIENFIVGKEKNNVDSAVRENNNLK